MQPKRKAISSRIFRLPSWWMSLAPGRPASFWVRVETDRRENGVRRNDHSGMTYIIEQHKGVHHDR